MPDPDDLVESDAKKARQAFQQYRQSDSLLPDIPKLLEHIMWALSITSVVFIVVALPWVGEDKLIPGTVWMGLGSLGIVGFGLCALLFRFIRSSFADADRAVSNRMERGR